MIIMNAGRRLIIVLWRRTGDDPLLQLLLLLPKLGLLRLKSHCTGSLSVGDASLRLLLLLAAALCAASGRLGCD